LDEPLSNLDKTLRVQMRQELLSLQRRLGLTTIFVTHDQEEAMTTADRMAVLDQGVVQQVGSPMQLYDEPCNAFVAHFVGTMNAWPVVAGEWPGVVPPKGLQPGDQAWLCTRPHHGVLVEPGSQQDERFLWVQGVVEDREFLGAVVRYRVAVQGNQVPQHLTLQIDEPHRAGKPQRSLGQPVGVGLDLSQARLLPR
jgi:iron(III) transport system ATP-binding protein